MYCIIVYTNWSSYHVYVPRIIIISMWWFIYIYVCQLLQYFFCDQKTDPGSGMLTHTSQRSLLINLLWQQSLPVVKLTLKHNTIYLLFYYLLFFLSGSRAGGRILFIFYRHDLCAWAIHPIYIFLALNHKMAPKKLVGTLTNEPLVGLRSNLVWLLSRYFW